ncbi:MAG: PhnD/SsuA/transferrin family substrate-binding protein [Rhodobacteraceae bacterium]|nr:PhnD/SsuA/transferrin family substrate-binding protein [Paracoccaceae bacterium]
MIASLPMYDRPETASANDRFWALIREGLGTKAPQNLTRDGDVWAQWESPELLLSQTCGLPFGQRLHGRVTLIGSPVHGGLDCPPGQYYSVLVVRTEDDRTNLEDFASARLGYNDELSQSGWAAPWSMAQQRGFAFERGLKTGSHRASARAVAEGRADIAAIDAVSWAMIKRWDGFASALREFGRSPPAPSLPFIAALGRDSEGLRSAITGAISRLEPADRDMLNLTGFTVLPAEEYMALAVPPRPPMDS